MTCRLNSMAGDRDRMTSNNMRNIGVMMHVRVSLLRMLVLQEWGFLHGLYSCMHLHKQAGSVNVSRARWWLHQNRERKV